jgi:hypothetical protein
MSELLERYGEDAWVGRLRADRDRIGAGDRYGIDHLLSAFGGMGNLTDLVFSVSDDDGTDELRRLRGGMHDDARALQRALDRRSR